jgi:hypothetical protein
MRRYLLLVGMVFFAVAILPAMGLIWFAWPFGAFSTPGQLAAFQARTGAVILPFDLRYNGPFKLARFEQQRPDVTWLSSSRAGTMRAWMFEPYAFYNMSFTAWTTEQLVDVFERTTRHVRPRIVIVELDYFLFTDAWEQGYGQARKMIYDQPFRYAARSLANFARIAPEHLQEFEAFRALPSAFAAPHAILSRSGFLSDGSYQYPPGFVEYARAHLQTAERLVESNPGAPGISERQKAPIQQLAEIARQRDIKLIAVQLPYIRSGVDYLDTNEQYKIYAGVWRDFESDQTRDWLRGLGIDFFDLARSPIDDASENFIDAFHPSDEGMRRVMKELLTDPKFRSAFPDIDPAKLDTQTDSKP